MTNVSDQLELLGLNETIRREVAGVKTVAHRTRVVARVMAAHEIKSSLPEMDDLFFLHSGLAQTTLPHSRPDQDNASWMRTSGNFSLIVSPGVISDDREEGKVRYVGVPYGPKARLIMIYLQTEGVKSRIVSLGPDLSSFLCSLRLSVTGGKNGSITAVREQCLRIARCPFTMQRTECDAKRRRDIVQDTKTVDGLELWTGRSGPEWSGAVELSARFQEHLKQHAVPLDKCALSTLSDNSLGLDLYTLFAYRLLRLNKELHLRWAQLQGQIGTSYFRPRTLIPLANSQALRWPYLLRGQPRGEPPCRYVLPRSRLFPPPPWQVAKAAFPKNCPAMRMRDELGAIYDDQMFASVYPARGQPAHPPWRLALVTVLQFAEGLPGQTGSQRRPGSDRLEACAGLGAC